MSAQAKLGGDITSANGNGIASWLKNCCWDVRHSETAVRDRNLLHILEAAAALGSLITTDQSEEIYGRLLTIVYDAAKADFRVDRSAKAVLRAVFRDWFAREVERAEGVWASTPGDTLKVKLKLAGATDIDVREANKIRSLYRSERLQPQYVDRRHFRALEGEIAARLSRLRSRLDVGEDLDSGPRMRHESLGCVDAALHTLRLTDAVPLHVGHGIVYELADRCVHRFRKIGA